MSELNKDQITKDLNAGLDKIKNLSEEVAKAKENGESIENVKKSIEEVASKMEANFKTLEAKQNRASMEKTIDPVVEKAYEKFYSQCETVIGKRIEAVSKEDRKHLISGFEKRLRLDGASFEVQASAEEKKAMNTIVANEGGFFTIPEYSSKVLEKDFEKNGILDVINSIVIGGTELKEAVDMNDYDDSDFVNELANAPVSKKLIDFKQMTFRTNEIFYPQEFTRNMLEDGMLDIEKYILRKLREGIMRKKAAMYLMGDGVDKPRGLLTYPNGTKFDEVEQIESNTTNDVKLSDVFTALPSALSSNFSTNAKYLMQRKTFFHLLAEEATSGELKLSNQIQFISKEKVTLYILGHEVIFDAFMPAYNITGNLAVAFGDFKQAYTSVKRLGQSIIKDLNSDVQKVKITLRERNGGQLRNGRAVKLLRIK